MQPTFWEGNTHNICGLVFEVHLGTAALKWEKQRKSCSLDRRGERVRGCRAAYFKVDSLKR